MQEIVFTYSASCTLRIRGDAVARALSQESRTALELPNRNPLKRYFIDGGPCGPIPRVVHVRRFQWDGGEASRSLHTLRKFAAITRGRALFVLFDRLGVAHGFEIDEGKLMAANVLVSPKKGKRA